MTIISLMGQERMEKTRESLSSRPSMRGKLLKGLAYPAIVIHKSTARERGAHGSGNGIPLWTIYVNARYADSRLVLNSIVNQETFVHDHLRLLDKPVC